MKKYITTLTILLSLFVSCIANAGTDSCVALKDGVITYSAGSYLEGCPIPLGVDPFGYNYQARKFNGSYYNSYANAAGYPPYDGDDAAYLAAYPTAATHWAWPYRNVTLAMKWNDAWIANEDCNNDGKLDRSSDGGSYIGSGAWMTNHQSETYIGSDGKEYMWNYFIKIVAAPDTAVASGGVWYDAAGNELGPVIWGSFVIIQEIYNDTGTGEHGVSYLSPAGAGVGEGRW